MSLQKNITSDWTIYSVNRNDRVIFDTNVVVINGNLDVRGNTTVISTTDTAIRDNKIILNDGELGAGVSAGTAGIEVDRGSLANVSVIWNESTDSWQLTEDGSTFVNIVATSTGLTNLVDDPNPTLGANLQVGSFWIVSTGNVRIDPTESLLVNSPVRLQYQPSFPTSISGENNLVAATPSTGGSGVFVINSEVGQQELVTKSKAIVFSLIF
jgi:hypothetical protein